MGDEHGLVWLLKDMAFPDPGWQRRTTIAGGLDMFTGLVLYWSFGWLLISGTAQPHYPLPEHAWFALMVWHWWPWLVLAWIWGTLFATNMAMKEASLSRYPGWAEYRQRRWWLVPYVL